MIPTNELGVIVLFAQNCQKIGLEIVSIQSNFPDAVVSQSDDIYRVEFEYQSSNFKTHGHNETECDLVICWIHNDKSLTIPVFELSDPNWHKSDFSIKTQWRQVVDYWMDRALKSEGALEYPEAERQVVNLYLDGGSLSECFRLLYKLENGAEYTHAIGGNQTAKVKEVLKKRGITPNGQ